MADEIVEKLSRIANDAASKIIEARDKASREMKFISVRKGDTISNFSVDEVRSYRLEKAQKSRAVKEHFCVTVEMKPLKQLDKESYGVVVEVCEIFKWDFDTFEEASMALTIAET